MWYLACLVIGYFLGIATMMAGYLYVPRWHADKEAIEKRLKEIENL